MNIILLDTETTDLIQEARLVQVAYKNLTSGEIVNEFFKPPVPISYGAMSVHHITEKNVIDKPAFIGSVVQTDLIKLLAGNILVAHNALFDINILNNEGVKVDKYIDTLRVAKHLIESEQYKLQYLRYFLNLEVEGSAHDAYGDIAVLELLFEYLKIEVKNKFSLSTDNDVIQKMLELTQIPVLIKIFAFGKYMGKTFEEVNRIDSSYLKWLYESETKKEQLSQNEDLIYTLQKYLGI